MYTQEEQEKIDRLRAESEASREKAYNDYERLKEYVKTFNQGTKICLSREKVEDLKLDCRYGTIVHVKQDRDKRICTVVMVDKTEITNLIAGKDIYTRRVYDYSKVEVRPEIKAMSTPELMRELRGQYGWWEDWGEGNPKYEQELRAELSIRPHMPRKGTRRKHNLIDKRAKLIKLNKKGKIKSRAKQLQDLDKRIQGFN